MTKSQKHTTTTRQYDDTYLDCRDLRHPWKVVGFYRQAGDIRRILECTRCGTQRNDHWHSDGQREPSSYSYAEGYQVEGGFDTYEVRREVIRRATIFKSIQHLLDAATAEGTPKVRRTR